MRHLNDFLRDCHGNFGIIFGLLALPLMVIAGVAVDYSRVASAEEKMQVTVDNAVGSMDNLHAKRVTAEAEIEKFINANSGRDTAQVDISIQEDKLQVRAVDTIDTPVLSLIGKPTHEISAMAEMDTEILKSRAQETVLSRAGLKPRQKKKFKQIARRVEKQLRRFSGYSEFERMSPQQKEKLLAEMQDQIVQMHKAFGRR